MGGAAKKNLRVFRKICGDKGLDHVRIVTTNWNLVDEKQGNSRQDALTKGPFRPLINEGAYFCPHDKGLESAQSIMSQLIHQEPVTLMIQEELNEGRTLEDTSAGALIVEEMKELKKKHDKEVEGLKKELEDASMANDEDLRLELAEERRKLEEIMARAEKDRKTLKKTRIPWETLPKSDVGKQPAATIAVPSVPPPPQHRYSQQGNKTTDRGSQLPQVLPDTQRVQPAVSSVPPHVRHRYGHQQKQGDDTADRGSQLPVVPDDTRRVHRTAPSVPSPPHRSHGSQRQGDNSADGELILHDIMKVIRDCSGAFVRWVMWVPRSPRSLQRAIDRRQ